MMKVGAIGSIFCMLGVVAEMVGIVMLWVSPIDYFFAGSHINLGSGISWAIGLILLSVGIFGLWKQYKHKFSLTVGIFGMVTMAVGLVLSIVLWWNGGATTAISSYIRNLSLVPVIVLITGILWLVLNGIFLILLGVNLVKLNEKTGIKRLTKSAGILTIITGATYAAMIPFGYLATQALALTLTVFLIYLFFKAK